MKRIQLKWSAWNKWSAWSEFNCHILSNYYQRPDSIRLKYCSKSLTKTALTFVVSFLYNCVPLFLSFVFLPPYLTPIIKYNLPGSNKKNWPSVWNNDWPFRQKSIVFKTFLHYPFLENGPNWLISSICLSKLLTICFYFLCSFVFAWVKIESNRQS